MVLESWILPILIGLIAAVLLLAILTKDNLLRQKFADLGALIQLQTSRPAYYGLGYVPVNYNTPVTPNPIPGPITNTDSPLWVDTGVSYPVFNYYPKAPLNLIPTNSQVKVTNSKLQAGKASNNSDLAFGNPDQTYNSHKAYYWALSGGYPYPYPFPLMVMPPTDMNKVQGVNEI
jgi:hypothetical protein